MVGDRIREDGSGALVIDISTSDDKSQLSANFAITFSQSRNLFASLLNIETVRLIFRGTRSFACDYMDQLGTRRWIDSRISIEGERML